MEELIKKYEEKLKIVIGHLNDKNIDTNHSIFYNGQRELLEEIILDLTGTFEKK